MTRYVLTLRCPDQPGIIRALAEGIFRSGGNIVDSSQYSDPESGTFFIRMELDAPTNANEIFQVVHTHLEEFQPDLQIRPLAQRHRAMVMVSKQDHCLVDLLYRWEAGQLPVELELVVSNHEGTREAVERHGIRFEYVPVTADNKLEAEERMLELMSEHSIDMVILARYMQVLSDAVCAQLPGRIINIHHSFLPAFKGAKPYHQAFERGVKIIGATAHYVTADLDEGPIIEQDVVRVTHATSPEELVVIGRDVERLVLARAVRLHAQDRVLLNGSRTVVFD